MDKNHDVGARHRRLLGLGPDATLQDVRRSYIREMKRAHPDLVGGDGRRARELNSARAFLESELRRGGRERTDLAAARSTVEVQYIRPSSTPTWSPNVSPLLRSGPRPNLVAIAAILYVGLLSLAVLGWLATTLLGAH